MITFNHGGEFLELQLTPNFLQQTDVDRKREWVRRIPRKEIAEVFSASKRRKVSCIYSGKIGVKNAFTVTFHVDGRLQIGCQTFNPAEVATMKRWALSRRRKKS